jgi:signal transduction histidine kinase
MIPRALSSRLLVALVAAQAGAIMLAMMVFPLVAPVLSFGEIADYTFRCKIEQAIVRHPGGDLSVRSNDELERYRSNRPAAAFAVMSLDDGRIVQGSNPALGRRLEQIRWLAPRVLHNLMTDLPNGESLIIATEDTRNGRLLFATTGNRFYLADWPSLMAVFLPIVLPAYGPVIFGALVLIPLVVSSVTRPLRRLSADAALVAPGPLRMRLNESGLGLELQGLARAVNAALARIEQGVDRQRLYAANAAHELRTPVAILGLHVDQLEACELRARLQSDVSRIQTLVEQIVTVARLGQNHVAMDEPIDLIVLLLDVVADRAPIAIREGRELEFAADVPSFIVRGNRQALFSAFANIVDNAIRAEPDGGTITVMLSSTGQVLVSDHGAGIAVEDRTHVFEPFWRGTSTQGGAGLGLAIVKEIADRHRVGLDIVDSEGGGATFRLHFPLDQATKTAPVSQRQCSTSNFRHQGAERGA